MRRRALIATATTGALLACAGVGFYFTPAGSALVDGMFPAASPSAPSAASPPADPVYKVDDTNLLHPLTEEQVRQIAYDVCPQALDAGNCLDYKVEITDLKGANGLVEVTWDRPKPGAGDSSVKLSTSALMLDRSLVRKPPQYVANVAAHEWNHIEQVHLVKNLAGYKALKKRAYEYYGSRVPGGLAQEDQGIEILTDCMASEGDNVPTDTGENPVAPFYIKTYMGATDTKEACGKWWSVLP